MTVTFNLNDHLLGFDGIVMLLIVQIWHESSSISERISPMKAVQKIVFINVTMFELLFAERGFLQYMSPWWSFIML